MPVAPDTLPSAPVQAVLGGTVLALALHALLRENGSVLGISGFVHAAFRPAPRARAWWEKTAGVAGLVAGGLVAGVLDGPAGAKEAAGAVLGIGGESVARFVVTGLLTGVGTKLANGCTSGHMLCGVSRFAPRSLAATATFFGTAVITSHLLHVDVLPIVGPADWTYGAHGFELVTIAVAALSAVGLIHVAVSPSTPNAQKSGPSSSKQTIAPPAPVPPHDVLRVLTSFLTSFAFALGLRLGNMSDPRVLLGFLLLPLPSLSTLAKFNPSLLALALAAIPLAGALYAWTPRAARTPRLGGPWSIPGRSAVDARLLLGAAVFGVGWGAGGMCPGPALVNLGAALAPVLGGWSWGQPALVRALGAWVAAVGVGGWAVSAWDAVG